ncbi:MAG: NADH-quinone oxidoreductase subunit NuoN [Francisellaceae bacterium]
MMLANILTVLPEITIAISALVVLLCDLMWGKAFPRLAYFLAQISLIVAAWITLRQLYIKIDIGFGGQTVNNPFTFSLQIVIFLIAFFVFVYAKEYIEDRKLPQGEFYALALLSILGAVVLTSAHSLLTVYIGLELLSLPLYALIAIRRGYAKGAEAAIKYFILGAISSGILLFGMSYIYGITGTIDLTEIGIYLSTAHAAHLDIVLIAMVFMLAAACFKLGAVPFHMWVPDVYEGSPNAVTAFLGTIPKIAAFAMLARFLLLAFPGQIYAWSHVIAVLAVISIFLGNIVALVQDNLKRLLGYSTISHIGFILLAFLLHPDALALTTSLYYVAVYALMAAAAFGLLIVLSVKGYEVEKLSDFAGLNRRNPWIAFLMLMVMFSMAGVPPFAGFFAKLFIIMGLVKEQAYVLAGYALIMSVIASYYYVRVVKVMYFDDPKNQSPIYANKNTLVALSLNALLILILGIFPGLLLNFIQPIYSLVISG